MNKGAGGRGPGAGNLARRAGAVPLSREDAEGATVTEASPPGPRPLAPGPCAGPRPLAPGPCAGPPPPAPGPKGIYIPPMAYGSARAFASAFRAIGLDAEPTPPSDHRTRELGARYTSGDECYPAKVTVGDFMKIVEAPGADLKKIACFMPTAQGPCRFGQYAPYLRQILDANGYHDVDILSPTSQNSYEGLGELSKPFVRTGWRALLCADLLQKLLLINRPYEESRGDADALYEDCLGDLCSTLEQSSVEPGEQLKALRASMVRASARFRKLKVHRRDLPFIGIVGEIFCRLNTFSNENLVQALETYGAEAWLSDIVEWIWYTTSEQFRKLKLERRLWTAEALGAWVRKKVQQRDEHVLIEPFHDDFRNREEPDIYEVLECARPYLPREGAFGEMVLNVGKAVYLARKGAAGIIDISPFTCMNGIVCEAIYPRISRDLGGIPIRNFYFDGTQSDLDRDLGVYMELARTYRKSTAS
jgi:predicted nucleotide-binding protein (sugar kinase/HSP70/actin superfamily)